MMNKGQSTLSLETLQRSVGQDAQTPCVSGLDLHDAPFDHINVQVQGNQGAQGAQR